MEDVWVWDKNRPTRIIPRAEVYTSGDVTVEELRGEGDEPRLTAEALGASGSARRCPRTTSRRAPGRASSVRPVATLRGHVRRSSLAMLLAVDVGNTQTVLGLYDGERLDRALAPRDRAHAHRRRARRAARRACSTSTASTGSASPRPSRRSSASGSGSPTAGRTRRCSSSGPGVKTGIPIRYDDPREVGPDRIVNAVAAKERYGAPAIVVDFGTSTNFDVVSPDGRVRRRRARAGDRDLDGGALRPRGAAGEGRLRRAAERDRQDDRRRPAVAASSTGSRARSTASSARIRGELEAPDAPRRSRPAAWPS